MKVNKSLTILSSGKPACGYQSSQTTKCTRFVNLNLNSESSITPTRYPSVEKKLNIQGHTLNKVYIPGRKVWNSSSVKPNIGPRAGCKRNTRSRGRPFQDHTYAHVPYCKYTACNSGQNKSGMKYALENICNGWRRAFQQRLNQNDK